MRDQNINTFEKGMMKDGGHSLPQNGFYSHAENIRILVDESVGESGVVVSVKGNKKSLDFSEIFLNNSSQAIPDLYFEWVETGSLTIDLLDEFTVPGTALPKRVWPNGTYLYAWDTMYYNNSTDPMGYVYLTQTEQQDESIVVTPTNIMASNNGAATPVVVDLGPVDIANATFIINMNEVEYAKIIGYTNIKDTLILFTIIKAAINPDEFGGIFKVDLTEPELTPITIYLDSPFTPNQTLNFNEDHPIQAIGRYENENIQRIYWTDNFNPVRTANILDPNLQTLSTDDLELSPQVTFSTPILDKVMQGGELNSGMYQYCYRLRNQEGAETRFSPPTNFIHVSNGSAYWDYQEDPENQNEYNGTTPGEDSEKKVLLDFEGLDTDYDFIEIVAIYKSTGEGVTSAAIIGTASMNSNGICTFIHTTNAKDIPISFEEVTAFTQAFNKAATLEAKDNRLFLGNLELTTDDLEFDATAKRYKITSEVTRYPYKVSPTTVYTNDINPLNNYDDIEEVPNSDLYRYQSDGRTLGGEGTHIEYRFTKKVLAGNTTLASSNPGKVTGSLKTSLSPGDYKDPFNVENFVGYRRDEIYRFGIVLYDLKGNPGFVNWIGDIRFPAISDVDWEGKSNLYTWALTATIANSDVDYYNPSIHSSGAALVFNYEEDDHNDMTDFSGVLNPTTSINNGGALMSQDLDNGWDRVSYGLHYFGHENVFNNTDNSPKGSPYNTLFALGIEFRLKSLPEELEGKVSGYSIVRVKREDNDKSIEGSGIISSWAHRFTSPPVIGTVDVGASDIEEFVFGRERSMVHTSWGDMSGNSSKKVALFGDPHHDKVFIHSPDFAFSNNYPSSTDNFLKVETGLIGSFQFEYTTDNVYVEKTFVSTKTHLTQIYGQPVNSQYTTQTSAATLFPERIFNIAYSNKISAGGHLSNVALGSGFDDEDPPYVGVFNLLYRGDWTDSTAVQVAGVGEECLFARLEIGMHYGSFVPNRLEFIQDGTLTEVSMRGNRSDKLYVSVKKRGVSEYRYGGSDETARAQNVYISTGHFAPLESDNGWQSVWGGDTYVAMYDEESSRRPNGNEGLHETSVGRQRSMSYIFPVETDFNITLRSGWHYANKTDFTADTDTPLNQFILPDCYSTENDLVTFVPKPIGFTSSTIFPSRVAFSHAKSNGALIDGWRKFSLYDYVDIDGNNGGINSLNLLNDFMFYIQDTAVGILSINPVSTVLDESGASIVLGSGKNVIQDFKDLNAFAGVHKFISTVVGKTGLFWIDRNSKILYKVSPKGVVPISEVKGLKSWFSTNIKKDSYITAGYDSLNNEVLFSVNDSHTIVYNEMLDAFTSIYTFNTPLFINLKNRLFSVTPDSSEMYEHGIGDYATWYESNDNVKLEFIVNKNPLYPKAFDSVTWSVNNSDGMYLDINNDFNIARFRVNSPNTLITEVISDYSIDGVLTPVSEEYSMREGMSVLHVPRNNDERMRGTYMKVQLESTSRPEDKIALNYVKTLFRISKR
jgi:hypothetical protein